MATTEVATLHCSKLSSDYFVLTRGKDALPFSSSSSPSPSPSYVVLISVLSPNAWLTHPFFPPLPYPYLPTSPRPQFPPILFSKQVCKTQFSRRLTSHLIARWNTVSPLLFSLFILPAIVAFIFPSPCIARVSLLSCTNNAILSLCTPASTITVTRQRFSKDRAFRRYSRLSPLLSKTS